MQSPSYPPESRIGGGSLPMDRGQIGDTPSQQRSSALYIRGYELAIPQPDGSRNRTAHLVTTALSGRGEGLWDDVAHGMDNRFLQRIDVRIMKKDSTEIAVLRLFANHEIAMLSDANFPDLQNNRFNHVVRLVAMIEDPVDSSQLLVVTASVDAVTSFKILRDVLIYVRELLEVTTIIHDYGICYGALDIPLMLLEDIYSRQTSVRHEPTFRLGSFAPFDPSKPAEWNIRRDLVAMASAIRSLVEESDDLDWLNPLIVAILDEQAEVARVTTARNALAMYHRLRDAQRLSDSALKWRLRKRSEGWFVRTVKDGLAHCRAFLTGLSNVVACCVPCTGTGDQDYRLGLGFLGFVAIAGYGIVQFAHSMSSKH